MRPRQKRNICKRPKYNWFKPAGIRRIDLDEETLKLEEYESIRLKDYLEMDQIDAAKKMDVSQPTFHRLLTEARKKIANAIINGKSIKIEGGDYTINCKDKNCKCKGDLN